MAFYHASASFYLFYCDVILPFVCGITIIIGVDNRLVQIGWFCFDSEHEAQLSLVTNVENGNLTPY